MDLFAQMRTFGRVVESGSFSAAARQLRMSVAAVSRQVAALEAEVGTTLLLRSTHGLRPTDAGRRYHARCLRILSEVDEARDEVSEGKGIRGRLVVSAPVTFGLLRVWPVLPALVNEHPALRFDLRLEDHAVDLAAEGVDAALRLGMDPPDSTSVIALRLGTYARWVVASPAYLRRRGVPRSPRDLAEHDGLLHLSARNVPTPWSFGAAEDRIAVEPRSAFRTNAIVALRDAAVAGLGLALLPEWLVAEEVAGGTLRRVLATATLADGAVHLVTRGELRGSATVRVLADGLTEAWRRRPAGALDLRDGRRA